MKRSSARLVVASPRKRAEDGARRKRHPIVTTTSPNSLGLNTNAAVR
jgi:hypothetical protein